MQPKQYHNLNWQQIDPTEIICLQADNNYTYLHFRNGQELLVAICLKELEKRLATVGETQYIRVHKSTLVNLQYIANVTWKANEPFITLANSYRVAIARRKRALLKQKMCLLEQVE